jgi:hypothetical protein
MKWRSIFLLCLWAELLAACRASPTAPPISQLDQSEQAWSGQNIASYRIEVLVVQSVWHAQSHQITVRDNQVVDAAASCTPAPTEAGRCDVKAFNAEDYIVPGLFAQARKQTQGQQAQWTRVTYDPTYGFPRQISFDDPNAVDEDWMWRVTAFEALK